MFPSSAIYVAEHSSSKLVIVDPPAYVIGGVAVLGGLCAAIVFGRWITLTRGKLAISPLVLLVVCSFWLAGFGLLSSRTVVTLARDSGRLRIERHVFGMKLPATEMPLSELRYAEVQIGNRRTKRAALVFRNGSKIGLGSFTNLGGQEQTVAGINAFLKGH